MASAWARTQSEAYDPTEQPAAAPRGTSTHLVVIPPGIPGVPAQADAGLDLGGGYSAGAKATIYPNGYDVRGHVTIPLDDE